MAVLGTLHTVLVWVLKRNRTSGVGGRVGVGVSVCMWVCLCVGGVCVPCIPKYARVREMLTFIKRSWLYVIVASEKSKVL